MNAEKTRLKQCRKAELYIPYLFDWTLDKTCKFNKLSNDC